MILASWKNYRQNRASTTHIYTTQNFTEQNTCPHQGISYESKPRALSQHVIKVFSKGSTATCSNLSSPSGLKKNKPKKKVKKKQHVSNFTFQKVSQGHDPNRCVWIFKPGYWFLTQSGGLVALFFVFLLTSQYASPTTPSSPPLEPMTANEGERPCKLPQKKPKIIH